METNGQGHAEHPLRVLIAERHRTIADSLERIVVGLGNAEVAAKVTDARAAIELGGKLSPDVAIVDLDLSPNCALVAGLKALSPETRIIVMSEKSEGHAEILLKALATGAVGAIYKEASLEELARALRMSSPQTPVVADEAAGLLLSSYLDVLTEKRHRDLATIEALAAAVEVRDVTTGHHLDRVTKLGMECMRKIEPGLAKNDEVEYGFTLHDIGKIGVPDAVLNKPGSLTQKEWSVMRQHPEMGVKIVEPLGFSNTTTDIILCHHEQWDGGGYPHGLTKEEIPLTARVFAVADAYDAMTSDRPYRSAMPHKVAMDRLRASAGSQHDPEIVNLFIDLKRLPVAS